MTEDNKKIIRGAGGPPPPPPPPTRTPDTLHSRQFATIQDLISEGEIEGFATASKEGRTKGTTAYNNAALKDIFLNKTAVLKSTANSVSPASTDYNFQEVTFVPRFGTSNQTFVPGIESSESPTAVGVTVTASTPVTRSISNSNVDAVKVTLTWPQLQQITDGGDILGKTVSYKIQIQYNSGGYTDAIITSVSGRSADAYQRDHRINLTGAFPVDVRVVRLTADAPDSNTADSFQFTSFSEVIDVQLAYPNSAYSHLRLDSQQFTSIPQRMFRIRGIKVRIPGAGASSSGTPSIDATTGRIVYPSGYIFNGTMGAAVWCSCPSMILLDLLTSTRYGLGDHITDSNLDLFSFVAASRYANEEVDDGTGAGTKEPRFSCHVNIQKESEAFEVINDLSSVMKCMPIWTAGAITITQDKPTDASYLFNLSNITSNGFSYTGSSLKQRHSVVKVSYFNMDSQEIDYEVVEDSTAINKFGVSIKNIKAFGCTSRNQAARLGRSILFAEQRESEVISFTTSIDSGAVVRPGTVIEVNDPVRAGLRRGGRLKSGASTTVVTVDDISATDLAVDGNGDPTGDATISIILPDGTLEVGIISDVSGGQITVNSVQRADGTTASSFSQAPNANTVWLIQNTTLQAQLFRVITVEEQEDVTYQISALSYIPGKYAFIEDGTPLQERTISILSGLKDPPGNLDIVETTIVINNIARSKVIISWQPVLGVSKYLVTYKFEDGNYVSVETYSPDIEILDTQKGTYEIQVFSYNALLQLSSTASTTIFTAVGKTALPDNVQNLTLEPVNEQFIRLRFSQSTAIDVLHGGRVYVRHSNLPIGSAAFQAAQDIIEAVAGSATEAICPALPGTYLVKFQDDGGRFSTTEAKVSLSTVQITDEITVKIDREDTDSTPFNGTKSNVVYDSSLGGLKLTNPVSNNIGTYDFVDTLDLGGVFSLGITRFFQGVGFYTGDQFDNRTELIDTWTDFDGSIANDANAKLQVRTSTDMSSYTDFNDVANGTFKGRGFQFRTRLETSDNAQNINLQQLGYTATLKSRTEQSAVIASGSAAKNVTFTNAFFVGTSALGNLNNFLPAVAINPQNMATGDYFEVTNVSGTGFTVHFKNSSNASINRNFTYQAVGFGKGG